MGGDDRRSVGDGETGGQRASMGYAVVVVVVDVLVVVAVVSCGRGRGRGRGCGCVREHNTEH